MRSLPQSEAKSSVSYAVNLRPVSSKIGVNL